MCVCVCKEVTRNSKPFFSRFPLQLLPLSGETHVGGEGEKKKKKPPWVLVICLRGKWKLSQISKCLDSSSVVISVDQLYFHSKQPRRGAPSHCETLSATLAYTQAVCLWAAHFSLLQLWAIHQLKRHVTEICDCWICCVHNYGVCFSLWWQWMYFIAACTWDLGNITSYDMASVTL